MRSCATKKVNVMPRMLPTLGSTFTVGVCRCECLVAFASIGSLMIGVARSTSTKLLSHGRSTALHASKRLCTLDVCVCVCVCVARSDLGL